MIGCALTAAKSGERSRPHRGMRGRLRIAAAQPDRLQEGSQCDTLGNVVGYEIRRALGPAIYRHDGRIVKRKYWDQTHDFFDKHGNKPLVIGRFVPIVRTFVTVIAGIGKTDRRRFFFWSAVGALLWVVSVTLLGYFVRQALPVLLDKLDVAIVLVVLVCLIPAAFEWWRHRRHRADDRVEQPQADTPRQDPA
jgi:membrane-associated protein